MITMRKDNEKKFKGSCFIEYENIDSMTKAVEEANEGGEMKFKHGETPFACIMAFTEWHGNKKRKAEKRKKMIADKRKGGDSKDKKKTEVKTEDGKEETVGEKRKAGDDDEDESKEKKLKVEREKGLIVKVTNIPKDATLHLIKVCLQYTI